MSFLTIVFACCRDVSPTILDFFGAGTYGRKSILDIIQFGPMLHQNLGNLGPILDGGRDLENWDPKFPKFDLKQVQD